MSGSCVSSGVYTFTMMVLVKMATGSSGDVLPQKGGGLQPARGQARIRSIKVALELMQRAIDEGWGDYDADK